MQLLCNLDEGLCRVLEFYLDACDEGSVNPFLCGDTADLVDNGAEVAFGETEAVGIKPNFVLLSCVAVYELYEAVKDVLSVARSLLLVLCLAEIDTVPVVEYG